MNTIRCEGLDGSNPLHFLAALGVLRLVSLEDAETTLAWTAAPHAPVLATRLDRNACHRAIARYLGIRGAMALQKRRRRLAAEIEKDGQVMAALANDKEGRKAAALAKRAIQAKKITLNRIEAAIEERGEPMLARWHPFVGAGDCIHLVPLDVFRRIAIAGKSLLWERLLPALACDRERQYKKDESGLSRTRFSFSNHGSGKDLLKDFRRNLLAIRPADGEPDLLGFSLGSEVVTGLMWEPAEQRNYALRWSNPSDEPTRSVPIRNGCAFVGLSFYPVVPANQTDRTCGFADDEKLFAWPIWCAGLRVEAVTSLLSAEFIRSPSVAEVEPRGIVARFQCEVVMSDKRNYFSPSRPV